MREIQSQSSDGSDPLSQGTQKHFDALQSNTLTPNLVGDCPSQFHVTSTYICPASVVAIARSLSGLSGSRLVPCRRARCNIVRINGACVGGHCRRLLWVPYCCANINDIVIAIRTHICTWICVSCLNEGKAHIEKRLWSE